ncbi:50S ribosomal protein L9 [Calorimonas adulescens]|uniref:Large ribosomal subunit protein bL9 n=1 Tax=Calorimonas adulescens TaxID=2606906 RepID=A0A5D8Q8P2_9THEO|nr:50S ribosomal protein L9 [Calorimonas adulescens]TZE80852.1 50S ribosomal protein L9 [Calorimonas adulescens]
MKVILTEDVTNLGKKNNVVNVSDGYARNFLFPRKLAVEANEANMARLKRVRDEEEKRIQKERDEAKALAERLNKLEVILKVKAGESGKLFGSVTSKDIADALKEQYGIELDKRKIDLKDAIKTTGVFEINVKLYQEIDARLKIRVEV